MKKKKAISYIFVLGFTLLNLGVFACGVYYLEGKFNFVYDTTIALPINFEKRHKQYPLEGIENAQSFTSLVDDKILEKRSTFKLELLRWYWNTFGQETSLVDVLTGHYFGCMLSSFNYIDDNKLREKGIIRPKVYEILCVSEEIDLYRRVLEVMNEENPNRDAKTNELRAKQEVERIKRETFYSAYTAKYQFGKIFGRIRAKERVLLE